jgi:hypothetical protein
VPQVRAAADPGLRVPNFAQFAGAGLEAAGGALTGLGGILQQQQRLHDATKTTEAEVGFDGKTTAELQRLSTEDDPARPGFLSDYEKFLGLGEQGGGLIGETVSGLEGVSREATEALRLQLLTRARRMATRAGGMSLDAAQRRADDAVVAAVNVTVAQAERSPDALEGILAETDRIIAKFAGTMTPDAERDQRTAARQANIEAAARGYAAEGRFAEARALLAGDHDEDLNPAARVRIQAVIDRAENVLEIETRRSVADAVAVLGSGKIPPDLATVQALAEGTEFAEPLQAAIEDRRAVESFIRLPVPEQAQRLKARAAQKTATLRDVGLETRLSRAHASILTAAKQGQGLALAAQAGVIAELGPLDYSDPASLRRRSTQATAATGWLGRPVSPATPQEADALAGAIDGATPGQVTGLLQSLHDGFGRDQAILLAGDIAPKRPELAAAITLVQDNPLVSREIILGGRLARENPDVVPGKTDRVAAIETVVGNLFTPGSAGALEGFVDAATALYAARRVPGGDLSYDADVFEDALADVMGRPVEFNNRTILPPIPGMDESTVEDAMEGLTQPDLIEYGNGVPLFSDGSPFTIDMFERGIFHTDAQLVTSGFGKYLVLMPGLGYAVTEDGGAYELDLRRFIDVRP